MALTDQVHVSEVIDGIEEGAKTVLAAVREKGLTANRMEHAAIALVAMTASTMEAVGMVSSPETIASFLMQIAVRVTMAIQKAQVGAPSASLSPDVAFHPDLEVVNLQADPPKETGL